MRRAALLAVGLIALLTGCASRERLPESSPLPHLPAQFDPPLVNAEVEDQQRWWVQLKDAQLDALIGLALASNHDVRTAVARIAEARALSAIVDARTAPHLVAGGAGGRFSLDRQSGRGTVPSQSAGGREFSLDASWELDVSGAIAHQQDAARAELQATVAQSGAVAVMVAGEVATTYFDLRAAQAQQIALAELIAIGSDIEQLVSVRERAGLATEFERLRATEQLKVTRADLPLAQQRAEIAARRLGVLVGGHSQGLLAKLAAPQPLPGTVPPLPVAVPGMLLTRRPDLIVVERRWQAAIARAAGARADRMPHLALGSTLGLVSISGGGILGVASGSWGLAALAAMLRMPLYAPELAATVQWEQARVEEAAVAYEQAVVVAVLEVEQALVRLARSREREAQLQSARDAALDALRLARTRYERGLTDFLPVLDAMRSRSQLEQQWIDARAQTLTHYVALSKALGGGWEEPGISPSSARIPR